MPKSERDLELEARGCQASSIILKALDAWQGSKETRKIMLMVYFLRPIHKYVY